MNKAHMDPNTVNANTDTYFSGNSRMAGIDTQAHFLRCNSRVDPTAALV